MINRKDILVMCSCIPLIMQNGKGGRFSDADKKKLHDLKSRTKPLTEKQAAQLKEILDKKEKSSSIVLSDSCKDYLRELYLTSRYGGRYTFLSKEQREGVPQMVRGIKQEYSAIQMLSDFRGIQYFKNTSRIRNEYLSGSVDVFDNKDVSKAKTVIELKTKGTIADFNKKLFSELDNRHKLQVQGYLSVSGKDVAEVVYCLVSPPEYKIQEQKELFYELKSDKVKNVDKRWSEIENIIRFNDIPLRERIVTFKVERDNKLIEQIHERVEVCRDWILEFEKYHIDWINQNK